MSTSSVPHSDVSQQIKAISYQLNSLRLQGLTRANSDQRLVLCLHGWLDNAASFLPLLENFDSYNMIAIDWPGHGHSDHRSAGAHYHFFDYVYDLLELCEVNEWKPIDIVGHSMGGMIGSAFASAFPEKVRSLTLIDSLGFIYADETKATAQLRSAMTARLKNNQSIQRNTTRYFSKATAIKARLSVSDLTEKNAALLVQRSLLEKPIYNHDDSDSSYCSNSFGNPLGNPLGNKSVNNSFSNRFSNKGCGKDYSKVTSQEKHIVTRELATNDEAEFCWRSDNRLRTLSPYRLTLGQAKQFMKDIKCPVKLIYADNGLTMIKEFLPIAEALIDNFSSEVLSGGHHIHMERPIEVASMIKSFISKI